MRPPRVPVEALLSPARVLPAWGPPCLLSTLTKTFDLVLTPARVFFATLLF